MAVTLRDIADRVGLTPISVSKALRGTGSLAPATRERILAAAQEMRYRPNSLARSIRAGRTGIVGFIFSAAGIQGNLPAELLINLQRELAADGYELLIAEIPDEQLANPRTASNLLRQWMADGMLINHQLSLPPQIAELIDEEHVPAVWINSKHACNCVYFDDLGGARAATRHLLSLGHKRIAYVDYSHPRTMLDGDAEHYSAVDRWEGYRQEMVSAGLEPWAICGQTEQIAIGVRHRFSRGWLAEPTRPTAAISYGWTTTFPVLCEARTMGLSIPKDLSLIDFSANINPILDMPWTIARVDHARLAVPAVRQLLKRINSPRGSHANAEPVAVDVDLVIGQSTAPPSEGA